MVTTEEITRGRTAGVRGVTRRRRLAGGHGSPRGRTRNAERTTLPDSADAYLPLDSVNELVTRFERVFRRPGAWTERGHLFVVTGERGYGKTRFIQRCVAWLRENATAEGCRVVVVDLSDNRWGLSSNDEKMRRTLHRIVVAFRSLNLLDAEAAERIEEQGDPGEGFHELGEFLASCTDSDGSRVILVVLLQGYLSCGQAVSYYNAAEKGMVFFAEMFEPDQVNDLRMRWGELNRTEVVRIHESLSPIKVGDFHIIAEWISTRNDEWPSIPEEIVDFVEEKVVGRASGAGAGEVMKLAWGMLREARAGGASEVTFEHIAHFYASPEDLDDLDDA